VKEKIAEAIQLRQNNKSEQALEVLEHLLRQYPEDPGVNYQIAWTFDSMGKESDAVSFYEKALANGLADDREGAFLGLGSTYRCLGDYKNSKRVFDQALDEFPKNRALQVFRALTLNNLGEHREAVSGLLIQLLETTNDANIKSYNKALLFYSDKLDETWK
jgi:tetratricopeptide (TPR) repeat protein